jgi:hypothetical protein
MSDVDSRSDDFVEIHMYADMIECCEESVALIDTATGLVRIIHQHARC